MSVLIKDMELPQNCAECPFLYDGDACYVSGMWSDMRFMLICSNGHTNEYRRGEFPYKEKRVDWCPLVEVSTPHGRLIDADKLEQEWIWGSTDRTRDVECIELRDLVFEDSVYLLSNNSVTTGRYSFSRLQNLPFRKTGENIPIETFIKRYTFA